MDWFRKYRLGVKLRMYSGWLLFFFAGTHLLNHSMGIFGLNTLENARDIFIGFWRLPGLTWVVVAGVVVHFTVVMYKLFTRKTYKGLSGEEWVQIVLGLLSIDLIIHHVLETKIASLAFGIVDSYTFYVYWMPTYYIILMPLMMIIMWTHGCIGIHYYIQQKQWFPRWGAWLGGIAVGLPIFAMWGVVSAWQEVRRLSADPEWTTAMLQTNNPRGVDMLAWTATYEYQVSGGYLLFILLFFLTRKLVITIRKRHRGVVIKYLEGIEVAVTRGTTLLEASLQANIPHAHVCGGRGRCSTCRVQIIEGHENLPPPFNDEAELLARLQCGPSVRLACRTKPYAACTIFPLLLPSVSLKQLLWKKSPSTGIDKNVAILFADLRGFTAMAEDKLPYDVVFVLNQYFQFMGQAIETHHGRIDKFIGDAIMAVFGTDSDEKQACRDALSAARSMRFQLDRLNDQLKSELTGSLKMGFGVHCGHVIIGEMGYKDSRNLVAIGDATNTASRFESLTKDFDCEMIVSQQVVEWAGLDFSNHELHTIEVRGRQKPVKVYAVRNAKEIEV